MSKRNGTLDFLKGCAAVCIVLHHASGMSGMTNFFYGGTLYIGYLVELFFMISGYLAVLTFREQRPLAQAFVNKCRRLYPTAMLSIAVFLALEIVVKVMFDQYWMYGWTPTSTYGLFNIFSSLTLTSVGGAFGYEITRPLNSPTWYLNVLVLCYALFYAAAWLRRRLELKSALPLHAAICLLGASVMSYQINVPFLNGATGRGYCAFFLGCCLAWLTQHSAQDARLDRRLKWGALAVLCVSAVLLVFDPVTMMDNQWGALTFVIYPALLLFVCRSRVCAALFNHSLFSLFGQVSFQSYLWHIPVFFAMTIVTRSLNIVLPTDWRMLTAFAVGNEIIALLMFLLVEKPLASRKPRPVQHIPESGAA